VCFFFRSKGIQCTSHVGYSKNNFVVHVIPFSSVLSGDDDDGNNEKLLRMEYIKIIYIYIYLQIYSVKIISVGAKPAKQTYIQVICRHQAKKIHLTKSPMQKSKNVPRTDKLGEVPAPGKREYRTVLYIESRDNGIFRRTCVLYVR
jgi:hypothetical protein